MQEYLTVDETAKRLGISVATVHRMLKRSQLPSVKVGKARRFPAEMLDSYLVSQAVLPNVVDTDSAAAVDNG